MSAERPWKIYLVAIAIICLLAGIGIGWVAKPPKEVTPPGYEEMQAKINEYEHMIKYFRHRLTSQPSAMISTLERAETPWGSIWYMVENDVRPDVETYKEWLTELLGKPPEEVTGTLVVGAWAGLGREDEKWWNEGEWGFHKIFPNVEVKWVYFEDEPDLRAKLELDPEWADVIEVCGSQWKLIEAGYLAPLDPSLIPLLAEFMPEWLLHYAFWYDNKLYGVLIEWGQSSLAYRTDIFEELGIYDKYPQYFEGKVAVDWGLLFEPIPELEGKLWMYDSVVEIMPAAIAYAAGTDYWDIPLMVEWTLDPVKWEKVKQVMYNFRPKVAKFFIGVEEAYTALTTGEAAGVFCWNDMYAAGVFGPDWELGTGDEAPVAWMMPVPCDSWGTAYCLNSRLQDDPTMWIVAHVFLNALADPLANMYKIGDWFEGAPNKYAWDMVIDYYAEWGPEYAETIAEVIKEMRLNDTYYYTVEGSYWIEPPDEIIQIWEEFWLEFKG